MSFEKSERTKRKIIETVAPIFNKKGYQGTALSDITSAVGLTKGAIYGNFGRKEALAEACFDYNVKFLQKGLYTAWITSTHSLGKLQNLINFYKNNYEAVAQNGGCPLMNAATEADDRFPKFRQKAENIILNWQKEIAAVIKEGQDNGEINAQIEPKAFANTFIALIEGGILIAKTTQDANQFYIIIENLKGLVDSQLKIKT